MSSQIPPESQRYAVEAEVVLRVGDNEPVTARLWNLSMTGMFITTDKTYPAGTELQFEFRLAEGDEPISGDARVAWRRQLKVDRHRPSGVGVQFQRLMGEGRKQVRVYIEENPSALLPRRIPDRATLRNVLEKLDVESPSDGILGYGGAAVAKNPTTSAWAPVLSGVALGVFLFGGTYLLFGEQLGQRAALASTNPILLPSPATPQDLASGFNESAPQTGGFEDLGETTPAAATSPVPTPLAEPADGVTLEIKELLSEWSRAWSQQEPDGYLAHYSATFQPGRGRSLDEWRDHRRDRIRAPEFVRVSVSDVEVEHQSDRAQVVFLQVYRSDTLEDVVRKTMSMVREDGSWRIASESSETIEVRRL